MKAQINIIEMFLVVAILLIAFTIFFPGLSFRNRWNEGLILLNGRDIILTLDRIGKLQESAFKADEMQKFLNKIPTLNRTNILTWTQVEGTVKNTITVACACSNEQINLLNLKFDNITFNGRSVKVLTCLTNLAAINPCIESSDVLLIWNNSDFMVTELEKPSSKSTIKSYLRGDTGVIEIIDFGGKHKNDELGSTQKEVFGITRCSGKCKTDNEKTDQFLAPNSVNEIIYQSYKYFFHLPVSISTTESIPVVPVEKGISPCSNSNHGTISLSSIKQPRDFWTCNNQLYVDTDGNKQADKVVNVGDKFDLGNSKLKLNFLEPRKIGISFIRHDFNNFLEINTLLKTVDNNDKRILLKNGEYDDDGNIPVVVLNSSIGRTAWISDFARDKRNLEQILDVEDDYRHLLTSLIFWSSNKKASGVLSPNLRIGFMTSYINAVNQDIYEVYRFNLGIGFPF